MSTRNCASWREIETGLGMAQLWDRQRRIRCFHVLLLFALAAFLCTIHVLWWECHGPNPRLTIDVEDFWHSSAFWQGNRFNSGYGHLCSLDSMEKTNPLNTEFYLGSRVLWPWFLLGFLSFWHKVQVMASHERAQRCLFVQHKSGTQTHPKHWSRWKKK